MIRTYTEPNERILDLLCETVLGSNGARYKHLDTKWRIHEADNPLFLTIERNNRVWGNLTFCRRGEDWYIRYFAFRSFLQSGGKSKTTKRSKSQIKDLLQQFFDEVFSGNSGYGKVNSMYAYIDPHNDRSKWLSEVFGFKVTGQLTTQTFSRMKPRKSDRLIQMNELDAIAQFLDLKKLSHRYFYIEQLCKPPYYVLQSKNGELLAVAKMTLVNWEIERLPGAMGGFLQKVLPFIPVISKLIDPQNFTFLVPDIIYLKDNNPNHLNELFESVLAKENQKVILWWVDSIDPMFLAVKSKIKWGLMHSILGESKVDIVHLSKGNEKSEEQRPQFVAAFDMV